VTAVGLERLQPLLDASVRWDRQLNDDEKQCLAIARVILQRPRWVVVNGAFEELDPDSRQRVEALFAGELAGIGMIDIARNRELETFLTRRVQLVTDPQGPTFSPTERLALYSQ
jgi:putative ATP-binding cassette transporter